MPSTAHGALGTTSNQSPIAADARASATFEASTSSSPVVKCSAGSVRSFSKISARSSVPTVSGPRARYSSASDATCASPTSWMSWALRRVVVK